MTNAYERDPSGEYHNKLAADIAQFHDTRRSRWLNNARVFIMLSKVDQFKQMFNDPNTPSFDTVFPDCNKHIAKLQNLKGMDIKRATFDHVCGNHPSSSHFFTMPPLPIDVDACNIDILIKSLFPCWLFHRVHTIFIRWEF
jgi:hypothetical protein